MPCNKKLNNKSQCEIGKRMLTMHIKTQKRNTKISMVISAQ